MGRRGPFLKPDGSEGGSTESAGKTDANPGGNEGEPKDGAKDGEGKVEFSEEQQRHIGKLLSAERKAAADKARADAKADADAAAERERKAKEEADLKAKGEFEKVETQLKADLETAQTEATSLKAENDQYRAAMAEGIEAGWQALPEAVRKLGEKQHAEDDVLGRFRFLHDPDTAALVKQLSEKADAKRGNGHDPKPSGTRGTVSSDEARAAQAPLYRRF